MISKIQRALFFVALDSKLLKLFFVCYLVEGRGIKQILREIETKKIMKKPQIFGFQFSYEAFLEIVKKKLFLKSCVEKNLLFYSLGDKIGQKNANKIFCSSSFQLLTCCVS